MTIILTILFGMALFSAVVFLGLRIHHPQVAIESPGEANSAESMSYSDNAECPVTAEYALEIPEYVVPFATREIHMPALPTLCTQLMSSEAALPLADLVPEPVNTDGHQGSESSPRN